MVSFWWWNWFYPTKYTTLHLDITVYEARYFPGHQFWKKEVFMGFWKMQCCGYVLDNPEKNLLLPKQIIPKQKQGDLEFIFG